VLVDRVLQRAHSVDQALDLVAVDLRTIGDRRDPVGVALQPRRGVRSALAAVGVQAEPPVVREEVRVGLDVGYHRLLVGGRVRLLEKRVARIVVVDDLERLPEPVAIQLRLPLVVHSPPPVGVPPLEAAVRDQFVHLVVVDDPVPHRVRLQPEPFGERARASAAGTPSDSASRFASTRSSLIGAHLRRSARLPPRRRSRRRRLRLRY